MDFNTWFELGYKLLIIGLLAVALLRLARKEPLFTLGGVELPDGMKWADAFMYAIGILILLWEIGVSLIILLRPPNMSGMDPATQAQALTLIGGVTKMVDNAAMLVLGYWYGTSRSSAAKDERATAVAIAEAAPDAAPKQ